MAFVTIAIFVLACAIGFAAWVTMVWNFVRLPFNLRKGLDPWGSGNPFNYVFQDDTLSPVGLAARKRALSSFFVFVSALVIGAIAGALTMWLS